MKEITILVNGMSCGHCVSSVEGAIQKLGAEGKVNLAEKAVCIKYDENLVSTNDIKLAIEDQGYDVISAI